ncbi:hypothetical protein N752_29830 [Desulforamulus aquiferis]|nr:hypothetical protein N752_29830 [Desulforamulus aquiferis]
MKIILENEMEKQAWEIMMSAHYKWEKNHGYTLQDAMSFCFDVIYNEEVKKMITEEVEIRLIDTYGKEYFCSEDEFILQYIDEHIDYWNDDSYYEPFDFQEIAEEISDWIQDYRDTSKEIDEEKETLKEDVRDELRLFYYTFFNAPEDLTVEFNGEVIQQYQDPSLGGKGE